ncbi:MAG: 3-hydroxyacyl-CoA dehydrogenase NAD-binding domain-containing protein [Pseudodonghicola sp.]
MTKTSCVSWTAEGDLAVITVDHPPLNLLAAQVRQGIATPLAEIARDPALKAAVLRCAGKGFFAGADVSEFGGEIARPDLPDLVAQIAAFPKPLVAAMHGTALGGGLEVALAATARVAAPTAQMGLPEIRLGLIPGCGSTTRLTRLAGAAVALDLVTSARSIGAAEAQALGIVDELPLGDLLDAAKALARRLAQDGIASPAPAPAPAAAELIETFRRKNAQKFRGQSAPAEAIACVERATCLPLDQALAAETTAFHRLEQGPQSKALRHVFFAEREARKLPDLPEGTAPINVETVGILGAGTMGRGIAMSFANAGLAVTLLDTSRAGLDRAVEAIAATYARQAGRGQITEAEAEARRNRITPTLEIADLSPCDLIVEAVFEVMEVKQSVFRQLDRIAKPGAILATNTSFLEIGNIAGVTARPDHVLGLHFFSPAHVMKLLEIVRGAETAPEVLLTAVELARRIGKVGVVVGDCHGFVGNRMLARRQAAAGALILEGALPWQVDRVLFDFGLPMGPFAMADLAGLDLGWDRETSSGSTIEECLCEAGRFGQKTGGGYYDYDETGRATPSELTERLLIDLSAQKDITRRDIGEAEILARCLDPMIEEGRKILAEGVAARSGDIDTIWVNGYGWPAWTGGPMYWADHGEG